MARTRERLTMPKNGNDNTEQFPHIGEPPHYNRGGHGQKGPGPASSAQDNQGFGNRDYNPNSSWGAPAQGYGAAGQAHSGPGGDRYMQQPQAPRSPYQHSPYQQGEPSHSPYQQGEPSHNPYQQGEQPANNGAYRAPAGGPLGPHQRPPRNSPQHPPAQGRPGSRNRADTPPPRRNTSTIVLSILVIILSLLLLAAAAYFFFGDRSRSDAPSTNRTNSAGGAGESAGPETSRAEDETTESETSTKPSESKRAEDFEVPGSWNKCAGSGAAGDLNLTYAEDYGGNTTTCGFATNVRDAFVDYYRKTDKLNGTVEATSPTTGQTYTMSCHDNGTYVTCSGGNNARVHIL